MSQVLGLLWCSYSRRHQKVQEEHVCFGHALRTWHRRLKWCWPGHTEPQDMTRSTPRSN